MFTAMDAVREAGARYKRHQPELTLLFQIVETYYPEFLDFMESQGKTLPTHIKKEFDAYLKCGKLEHGFLRVRCEDCHHERLVAFSCKKRGFCPSCGARRMAESAALLVDDVLPTSTVAWMKRSGIRVSTILDTSSITALNPAVLQPHLIYNTRNLNN